jgi:selenocysteine-specific translation elongation factor
MDDITVGVFGTDQQAKAAFENAVAKKSEAEGIAVHMRTEGGRRYSFLDVSDYPGRIQGYASIASFCDHALYLFPRLGRLSAPDGEIAVLLSSFGLPGTIELLDGTSTAGFAASTFKGTAVAQYRSEERQSGASTIDLSYAVPRSDLPREKPLVYIDRAFTVKGVGTVALGFVLSGTVSVHDQLRPIPSPAGLRADVKGIQVSDVDFESVGRGIRVGLSLRGVEPKDLDRSHWLDDGTFEVSDSPSFELSRSPFYKQEVASRDLHLQLPGEMTPVRLSSVGGTKVQGSLPWQVPVWDGMRGAVIDLNGGALRVAGGLAFKF